MSKIPQFSELIIHEDEHLLLINKPAMISSLDDRDGSGINILKMAKRYHAEAQLCHRLDKETSGILVIAKDAETYREMAMSFEARRVEKTYHAIVEGVLRAEQQPINLPLGITRKGTARVDVKEGKPAETIVSTLQMYGHYTLLACQPITGRLHQIRIHLASQHFPIVSDETYGGHFPMLSDFKRNFKTGKFESEQPIMKRVALHAYSLKFELNGKTYDLQAPYPKDFEVFLKLLEKFDN